MVQLCGVLHQILGLMPGYCAHEMTKRRSDLHMTNAVNMSQDVDTYIHYMYISKRNPDTKSGKGVGYAYIDVKG